MKRSLLGICIALCIVSCQSESGSVNPANQWTKTTSYPAQEATEMQFVQDRLIVADNSSSTTVFYTGTAQGAPWTATSSSFGSVASLVTYGGNLYCVAMGTSVYYSTDFCKTWVQKNNGLPDHFNIADLVATDAGLYVCGDGLYYSNDKGDTWKNISIQGITRVLSVAYIDHTLIASTNAGLYNSSDDGGHWAPVISSSGVSNASISTFAVINNAIYAASGIAANSAVFASYDKGNTWTRSNGLGARGFNAFYAFEFYDGTLYVASTHGVFESIDNGRNWVYSGCDNVRSLARQGSALYSGSASQGLWSAMLQQVN